MAPPIHPLAKDVLDAHKARLARLVNQGTTQPLKRIYDAAAAELERKLAKAAGRADTMTSYQQKVLLAQVKMAQAQLSKKMSRELAGASADAQTEALRALAQDIPRMEAEFRGAQIVLPIEEASRFQGVIDKRRTSLLRAHDTSMARYGVHSVEAMERQLSLSLSTGETTHQAIDRLLETHSMEWYQAERIARTEVAWAYNATTKDGIEDAAKDVPDMYMRWNEHVNDSSYKPLDDRVGVDSIAMHGQLAKPGSKFTMPAEAPAPDARGVTKVHQSLVGQSWEFPPNRPNDRAVISPWRAHWGTPGWRWEGGRRVPVKDEPIEVRPPPEPTEVSKKDIEPATLEKERPAHGVSLPVDKGAIENQTVQTRTAVGPNGTKFTEFQWKMTPGFDASEQMKALQASKTQWDYPRYKPNSKGVLVVDGRTTPKKVGEALSFEGTHKTSSGSEVMYSVLYGTSGANKNRVRLRVSPTATGASAKLNPADALEAYEKTLQELGVSNPRKFPTAADRETLIKMKVAGKFNPEDLHMVFTDKATEAEAARLARIAVAKHPIAADVLADAEIKETYFGHQAPYSKALGKYLKDNGVIGLTHDSSCEEPAIIADILMKDGLMSSASRFNNGIFTEGMSTGPDFATGGADGLFTRVIKNPADYKRPRNSVRYLVKTEEMGRLDWWAFDRDRYGAAGPNDVRNRWSAPDIAREPYPESNNEVVFQRGVKPDAFEGVVTNAMTRQAVLAELRRRGVTKLNGVDIDTFIQVR